MIGAQCTGLQLRVVNDGTMDLDISRAEWHIDSIGNVHTAVNLNATVPAGTTSDFSNSTSADPSRPFWLRVFFDDAAGNPATLADMGPLYRGTCASAAPERHTSQP